MLFKTKFYSITIFFYQHLWNMEPFHNSLHPNIVNSSVKCVSTARWSWQLSKGCASYHRPYILSQIIAGKNKLKYQAFKYVLLGGLLWLVFYEPDVSSEDTAYPSLPNSIYSVSLSLKYYEIFGIKIQK